MEEDITLSELLGLLKRHISKIVLGSFFGLIIMGAYTFFLVTPEYASKSTIVVNQTQTSGQAITNADIQTNINLISTYQRIIKEPIILEDVLKNTKSNLSVNDLRNKITVQTDDSSLVFDVLITDENPYFAAELANAVARSFESKIGDILEVESVTILSEAQPNLQATSPNVPTNLAVGFILGMILGIGLAFLSEYMDNTVKGSKFINENIGWTDLGTISLMTAEEIEEMRSYQSRNLSERRQSRRVL